MKPVFAIDASHYIFRSYFALDPLWQSEEGMSTEAVYGFAAFLLRLLKQESPKHIAAAFDESLGTGFRHRIYAHYKANRALPDEALAFQLQGCKNIAQALGIRCYGCGEYEADDYLAAITAAAGKHMPVFVLSRDKDLSQLLCGNVRLWDYGYGEVLGEEQFVAKNGYLPTLLPDWLALTGDSSDNIPGVPGIGPKTATAIVSTLGPQEQWIDLPEKLAELPVRGCSKLPEKIAPYRNQINMAKQLATLVSQIDPVPSLEEMTWRGFDINRARDLFAYYGLQGLIKRLESLVI